MRGWERQMINGMKRSETLYERLEAKLINNYNV